MGIPMQVVAVNAGLALCQREDQSQHQIDLSLVGQVEVGDWVLVFTGAAMEVISPERAQQIQQALSGLAALLRGEALPDEAFADLCHREPQLPPHLQRQ
ncbi:HypC/HybG/HupF family hydrogenase formation chaperone [Aquaspirillum soli]